MALGVPILKHFRVVILRLLPYLTGQCIQVLVATVSFVTNSKG